MFYDGETWVFGIILAVLIGGVVVACNADEEHRKKFMADCMQDHKQYECDALWRAGEDHTTVMPVPIYVGK